MTRDEERDPLTGQEQEQKRALAELWPVKAPPSDFADKVVGAWQGERSAQRLGEVAGGGRGALRWRLLAAAVAACLLALLSSRWLYWPQDGATQASQRVELQIGSRAVAVAEAGADLEWRVGLGGASEVRQAAGEVFYRVASGARFDVETPAGQISVRGTCFRVEVVEMAERNKAGGLGLRAQGAALGAVLGAAVVVTVYEGGVVLARDGAQVEVGAGQLARAGAGEQPHLLDKVEAERGGRGRSESAASGPSLSGRAAALEARLQAALQAEPARLRAEVEALRGELEDVRDELALEKELRKDVEGEAIPFPDDLDDRYRQAALKQAFTQALARAGVRGTVDAIDCTEYPCIVFGELFIEGQDQDLHDKLQRFQKQLDQDYPKDENGMRVWVARAGEEGPEGETEMRNLYGISVMPSQGDDEPVSEAIGKRLMFRSNQYLEATVGN